ncbi:MAG: CPBP family intramembrane metalloprotease [Lewinellaceae bacterium]|nr:CPBP family intramembrane metalloprotease [Lewinellaceae bacterium]
MNELDNPVPAENGGMAEPEALASPKKDWPQVRVVLIAQFALFVLCISVYQVIGMLAGWADNPALTAEATSAERWNTRLQLGLGHLLGFGVAGFLTVWLFYRNNSGKRPGWQDYLGVRRLPGLQTVFLAIMMMAVSLPLVLFLLNINQMIPLPDFLKSAEDQAEEAIKGLLIMDNSAELLANLFIIALLPAIGEELVFRGVVQQQLMRRIANPWVALLVSAAVFSFVHFQFEGFLSRMLLGLILGWLYWRTRNFWVPAIAHFFNNGLQVAGQYFYSKDISTIDLEQDIQVPWFAALLSTILILVTVRLFRESDK